jgi:hypothetical protein
MLHLADEFPESARFVGHSRTFGPMGRADHARRSAV